MKTAANDSGIHPVVDDLGIAIQELEEHADELSEFDYAEVHRLYAILQNMVEE